MNSRMIDIMDKAVDRRVALIDEMNAMTESYAKMHVEMMALKKKAILARKEDLMADVVTTLYNCILDLVDPKCRFRNWTQFYDEKLYAEESAIMEETEEDDRDWHRDLEVLTKYHWHSEVIQAVFSMDISIVHFSDVIDTYYNLNGQHPVSIRPDRRRGVNQSNLREVKKEYDSLKLECSSTYDEAFDAIAAALK